MSKPKKKQKKQKKQQKAGPKATVEQPLALATAAEVREPGSTTPDFKAGKDL